MNPYQFLNVKKESKVLTLTINRPDQMNAINTELNHELEDAFNDFSNDDELWVAVLRGAGSKAFSAGGDIKAMSEAANGGKPYIVPKTGYGGLTNRHNLNKPIIAAVNGLAMGGGFEIALACDLIIAADHATFALPEPLIGVVAYAGGMHRLYRQIGTKRAMQLLLCSETIDAKTALDWGLINEVVPLEKLDETVNAKVQSILRSAPLAIQATKACVNQGANLSLEEALALQDNKGYPELEKMRTSQDILEGIKAFTEKRKPQWQGK